MSKLPIILLLTLLLSFFSQMNIDAATYTELENEINQIKVEKKEMKQTLKTVGESQELVNQYSKLVAKENAYKRAIDYLMGDIKEFNSEYSDVYMAVSKGELPASYLPIYKAAGEKYGVDWTVLAAIHSIETSFSTSRSMVSYAGAIGPMQFMPATFSAYGVDGNGDGRKDPWNLEDAIFSAANYLVANGFSHDKRKAIWHYNHADWYVNKVLATAMIYSIKGYEVKK